MKFIVTDNLTNKISDLKNDFPKLGNFIVSRIAIRAAEYIRERKLSGQALRVRTGKTKESTKAFKEKTGRFAVRPGVGIKGRLNYLYRFIRKGNPFMQRGMEEFEASGEIQEIGNDIIQSAIRKRGF